MIDIESIGKARGFCVGSISISGCIVKSVETNYEL